MHEIIQTLWFSGFVVFLWWVDQNERSRLLGVNMKAPLPEDALALTFFAVVSSIVVFLLGA